MRRKGDEFRNGAAPAQPRSTPGGDPETPNRAAHGGRAENTPGALAQRPPAGESAMTSGRTPGTRPGAIAPVVTPEAFVPRLPWRTGWETSGALAPVPAYPRERR